MKAFLLVSALLTTQPCDTSDVKLIEIAATTPQQATTAPASQPASGLETSTVIELFPNYKDSNEGKDRIIDLHATKLTGDALVDKALYDFIKKNGKDYIVIELKKKLIGNNGSYRLGGLSLSQDEDGNLIVDQPIIHDTTAGKFFTDEVQYSARRLIFIKNSDAPNATTQSKLIVK